MTLIDRTRVETDWVCPRRRYWATEWQGRGLTRIDQSPDLEFGQRLHAALRDLALSRPRDEIAAALRDQPDPETACLAEGLFWGFARVIWPRLMDEYDIVAIEAELSLPLPGTDIALLVQPDLALRRRSDGTIWYCEYKTTSSRSRTWMEGWDYAIQLHVGAAALARAVGEPVEGAFVVGLYKGWRNQDGLRISPFTWVFALPGQPGLVADQWTHEYRRGLAWERRLASEYPGGLQAWVAQLPEDVVADQFVVTPPIGYRRDLVDAFLRQQARREHEIGAAAAGGRPLEAFPQFFSSCQPAYGSRCPYLECCWVPGVAADPLASGLYRWREPHHRAERVALGLDTPQTSC